MLQAASDKDLSSFEKWGFPLLFLVAMSVVVVGIALPFEDALVVAGGLLGALLVVILPIYPQILFPLMIISTALDYTGTLVDTTKLLDVYEVPITAFHIMGGGALLFSMANAFLRGRTRLPRLEINLPLILFLAVVGISVSYSVDRLEAAVDFVRLLFLAALMFATVLLIENKRDVIFVTASVIICTVAASVFGIYQALTEEFYLPAQVVQSLGATVPRAAATFHNPNYFAVFLMMGLVLSTAIFVNFKMFPWKRAVLLLGMVALMSGIVISFSRTSWLATVVGVCSVVLLSRKIKFLFVFVGVIAIIVLFITFVSENFVNLVIGRFTSLFTIVDEMGSSARVSSSGRIYFMIGAWRMFLDNPFFGVGFRSFPVLFDRDYRYRPIEFPNWFRARESHTLPANLLAELGLVGFTIAAWLMFSILLVGIRGIKEIQDGFHKSMLIGYVSVFVAFQASMLFTADINNNFLWIMTGMLFAVKTIGTGKTVDNSPR